MIEYKENNDTLLQAIERLLNNTKLNLPCQNGGIASIYGRIILKTTKLLVFMLFFQAVQVVGTKIKQLKADVYLAVNTAYTRTNSAETKAAVVCLQIS